MKVYILGAMRGVKFYAFPAFDAATDKLSALGYVPISPADIDRACGFDPINLPEEFDWNMIPESLDLKEIMRRDLMAIVNDADGYHCLPGWEQSKGACAELAVCKWKGIPEIRL